MVDIIYNCPFACLNPIFLTVAFARVSFIKYLDAVFLEGKSLPVATAVLFYVQFMSFVGIIERLPMSFFLTPHIWLLFGIRSTAATAVLFDPTYWLSSLPHRQHRYCLSAFVAVLCCTRYRFTSSCGSFCFAFVGFFVRHRVSGAVNT